MKIATILVVAISLATALTLQGKVCKEFCNSIVVPDGWEEISRAGKSEIIRLHIGLKLRNTELLEEIVMDVSDPESKNYGKHLTFAELHEIVAPSARALSDVTGWLESRRLSYQVAESKDWIIVDLTVDAAEQLLSTEFYNFRHTSGQHLIRSYGPYFVPQELDAHIDLIGGIVRFPKVRTLRVAKSVAERQMDGLYPGLIKQAFNIPANLAGQSSKNSQAVAQFAVYAQYFDQSDLTLFQQTYNLTQQSPQVFGPNDPNNPGDEAMLDIEYIMGMAENVESWFVSTNGTANGGQEPFLDWIVAQKNNPNSPWVHSISYGDSENTVSLSYAVRCTQEFQIFGASGRTLFFASGDDGANCNGSTFDANFPAASPYVTSVGGITTSDSYARQANQFIADEISSGGFSDYFSRPAYQAAAVQNYLTSQRGNLPPSGQYNSTGRGFPDIASFSENINIALGGGITPVAGTSCAAPVIAGVFSLLNDARFMKGKASIGFANPLIYNLLSNHPDAFQDITTGSNEGCGEGNGFPAAPGWDAVTGVGAPNFPSLLNYVLQYAKN